MEFFIQFINSVLIFSFSEGFVEIIGVILVLYPTFCGVLEKY